MPIWATVLAWPVLGERPTVGRMLALVLGIAGVTVLLGGVHGARPEILPGVACALGAAVLFAFGTVALRSPLGLPPLTATAWQVGLGCVPMVAVGVLLKAREPAALSPAGRGRWPPTAVRTAARYLSWFAALRRLPPPTAWMGTLLTPLVGVVAAAIALGEPFGVWQILALTLTLGGVSLAIRQRV